MHASPKLDRLKVGFSAILSLLAVACVLAVVHSSLLAEQTGLLLRHPFTVSVAIRQLDAEAANIRRAMREAVTATEEVQANAALNEVAQREQEAARHLDTVRQRYLGPQPDVDRLGADLERWRILRGTIVEHMRQGNLGQADALARGEAAETYAKVAASIEVIALFARSKAAFFSAEAQRLSDRMVAGSVLGGLAAMFLGLIIAGFVFKSENELERARSIIKNIINSMPSVVIGVDAEGLVTHVNHKAAALLSPGADPVGDSLEHAFPTYASQMETIATAIRERTPVLKEKQARAENGATRYQDVLVYPLVANGATGAVLRIDDVTERVRLAEMMVQTEKMMSVGGLAAGMAHEINNPLGAIVQSAQVVQRHVDPDLEANRKAAREAGCDMETIRRYMEARHIPQFLDSIREAGSRAARIVANMLEFSRGGDSRHEPVSLHEILNRALELAASDYDLKKKYDFRHVVIKRDFDPDLPPALCSRTEIEQVALNLLRNAAQAMRLKTYEPDERPTITLRTSHAQGRVVFEVRDNGPGMDEAVRKRVFEPFFTTKEPGQGTGLGLSVSYFIVTSNHAGSVAVRSAPGQGAVFSVEIPAAA